MASPFFWTPGSYYPSPVGLQLTLQTPGLSYNPSSSIPSVIPSFSLVLDALFGGAGEQSV